MKTQAITKFISDIASNSTYEGIYKITYALVSALPDKAFMEFVEAKGFPEIYDKSIIRRGLKNSFSFRQRSAINSEIKELLSPQCKRKGILRDNLKKRYKYAFPKDQEKVLRCMLFQSTVKERQWAYSKLKTTWSIWGKSFTEDILTIFEKHQDSECANLIVSRMPASIVYKKKDVLAEKIGWQRVFVAIGKEYPETVDLSRLTTNEAVRTIVRLELHEYKKKIEDILYTNILREIEYILSAGELSDVNRLNAHENAFIYLKHVPEEVMRDYYCEYKMGNTGKSYLTHYFRVRPPENQYNIPNKETLSIRDLGGVSLALWAMSRLGMADEIVRFAQYDMATEETIVYTIRDYQDVPFKIETWLFKAYNYILTTVYGELALSENEMTRRFIDSSSNMLKEISEDFTKKN